MRTKNNAYINRFYKLPKHGGVYILTDKDTGMQYIGSSFNVQKRAHQHCIKWRGIEFPYRSKFKSVKIKNITVELLKDCKGMSQNDLLKIERDFIIQLNTIYPNGLNSILPSISQLN